MTERTASDVAEWMAEQVTARGYLEQYVAIDEVAALFGGQFVYEKEGTRAISKSVLSRFTKLTKETVVWEKYAKRWRPREPGDAPGRMQR